MIYLIFINVYIDKCFNYALKRYLAKDIGTMSPPSPPEWI